MPKPTPFHHSSFNIHNSPPYPPKSLHPFFDSLAEASTTIDAILETLNLTKEETEAVIASDKYKSHRQLRTTLLRQQLQILAQHRARHALQRLLDLTDSRHPDRKGDRPAL